MILCKSQPIQHTRRRHATIAMRRVDLVVLHHHLCKYSTLFLTQETCVSIIVKGCVSDECLIHIKQQSNGLGDRILPVALCGWLFI